MQKTTQQEIALCGAPAGSCGFRGRDWRRGQLVAGYSIFDGAPYCACGSEMRSFQPRRFIALDAAQSVRADTSNEEEPS